MSSGRRWSFFGLAVLAGLLCFRLGLWQLDRLSERRARNESIAASLRLPSLDLSESGIAGLDLAHRRVVARGRFDAEHEVVLRARSFNGVAGTHLVTPLLLEGSGSAVLVDRGWIPNAFSDREARRRYIVEQAIEIQGLALPSQEEPSLAILADPTIEPNGDRLDAWRVLNVEGIQKQIPYPLLQLYIAQTEPLRSLEEQPIPASELDLGEGPHLAYAIQWFAFASIAFIGGAYWMYRSGNWRSDQAPPGSRGSL